MKTNVLFPIGSVVSLKGLDQAKLIIIGYYPQNREGGKIFDYLAVPYPYGLQLNTETIFFDHSEIGCVCFKGYENQESLAVSKALPVAVKIAVATDKSI